MNWVRFKLAITLDRIAVGIVILRDRLAPGPVPAVEPPPGPTMEPSRQFSCEIEEAIEDCGPIPPGFDPFEAIIASMPPEFCDEIRRAWAD
jgi:hypothetical protein